MRQNMVFSTKNTKNFLGRRHDPLPRPFPQLGGGYPLPMSHPTQRLRHLDPSHSKILGYATDLVFIFRRILLFTHTYSIFPNTVFFLFLSPCNYHCRPITANGWACGFAGEVHHAKRRCGLWTVKQSGSVLPIYRRPIHRLIMSSWKSSTSCQIYLLIAFVHPRVLSQCCTLMTSVSCDWRLFCLTSQGGG